MKDAMAPGADTHRNDGHWGGCPVDLGRALRVLGSDETKVEAAVPRIQMRFTHALQRLDQAIFDELKAQTVGESAKLGKTPVRAIDALRPFLAA
jgi:hypothetical protein